MSHSDVLVAMSHSADGRPAPTMTASRDRGTTASDAVEFYRCTWKLRAGAGRNRIALCRAAEDEVGIVLGLADPTFPDEGGEHSSIGSNAPVLAEVGGDGGAGQGPAGRPANRRCHSPDRKTEFLSGLSQKPPIVGKKQNTRSQGRVIKSSALLAPEVPRSCMAADLADHRS